VITLRNVYFKFDKWVPRKRSEKSLDRLAALLQEHPALTIRVEGHTDSIGSVKYNRWLSQKRADAVRKYLLRKGIAASRVEAIGYGEERPIASNKTLAGRRQNRRVEVHFTSPLPETLKVKIRKTKF
jgi:OOP family OmpA-OmpF porin